MCHVRRSSLNIQNASDPISHMLLFIKKVILLFTMFTDNMLFIIGGRNNTSAGNIDTASVDRYDPLRDEWKPVAPLSVPRNRLGVAAVDGCIFAIGGGNGNTFHTSVEKYDPKQDEWTTVMPLNFPRIGRFPM